MFIYSYYPVYMSKNRINISCVIAIVWCLDHEDDDMGEEENSWNSKEADDELDEDISIPGWYNISIVSAAHVF
jgi:hypothetical protein